MAAQNCLRIYISNSSCLRGTPSPLKEKNRADENDHVLVTHDLDFGSLLAAGAGSGPSVVQIRVQDITPAGSDQLLIDTLRRFERELKEGVLISVDTMRSRVRILPLR
jgi:hypothetical protein